MPKIWNETIEAHRAAVTETIFATAARLVEEGGVPALTMSRLAEEAGIGRATLYKYFGDVNAVLVGWHQRLMAGHMDALVKARHGHDNSRTALEAVLLAYAEISRRHHGRLLAGVLHGLPHARHANDHLRSLIERVIGDAVRKGDVRNDASPAELSRFVVAALAAADAAPSKAVTRRVVTMILQALEPART